MLQFRRSTRYVPQKKRFKLGDLKCIQDCILVQNWIVLQNYEAKKINNLFRKLWKERNTYTFEM